MPIPACHIRPVRHAFSAIVTAGSILVSGCSMLAPNRAVLLSSTPPGATIKMDGHNIGFVTPCQLALDIDDDVRLDFELPGFKTETRFLTPDDEVYSILWREMYVGEQTWRFPLFLPLKDFLVPVKWTETHAPGRLHIALDRLADEGVPPPAPSTPKPEPTPSPTPAADRPTAARSQ